MNSSTFLYIVYFLSVFMHIVSIFIISAFVIPLQTKQAQVKNGLQILRKQLLLKGILALVVSVVSVFALTSRFFTSPDTSRYVIVFLVLIHASGNLGKVWLDYLMYHQQYSPRSKAMHARIADQEEQKKS